MFNLYTPPCFAAMGAMNSEIKDKKWLLGGIMLQFATGYTIGYLVYTIGTLFTEPTRLIESIGGTIGGLVAVIVIVAVIIGLIINTERKMKKEYALKKAA